MLIDLDLSFSNHIQERLLLDYDFVSMLTITKFLCRFYSKSIFMFLNLPVIYLLDSTLFRQVVELLDHHGILKGQFKTLKVREYFMSFLSESWDICDFCLVFYILLGIYQNVSLSNHYYCLFHLPIVMVSSFSDCALTSDWFAATNDSKRSLKLLKQKLPTYSTRVLLESDLSVSRNC